MNVSLIKGCGIGPRISHMLSVRGCEIVIPAKVFLGTHIDVVVLGGREYRIDGVCRWDADRTRRESLVKVGIVGRHNLQMLM